ncbi:hypothetical protein DEO72_LG8g1509 [Vigna unguiculata]|uniref:Uncharacterized protein n=1 Tax=Vigna unguiculata TaxID=3917 RepID=A0A4D6MUA5_VIGUN|nr:hypothetical protein DEO72_LG8g1509 [Vigna unguiculata]
MVIDAALAVATFTVVFTDAASGFFKEKRPCLAREKKKQGKEATYVVWFSPATPPMDWLRRRRLSSVVGRAVAARTLWCAVRGRRAACA